MCTCVCVHAFVYLYMRVNVYICMYVCIFFECGSIVYTNPHIDVSITIRHSHTIMGTMKEADGDNDADNDMLICMRMCMPHTNTNSHNYDNNNHYRIEAWIAAHRANSNHRRHGVPDNDDRATSLPLCFLCISIRLRIRLSRTPTSPHISSPLKSSKNTWRSRFFLLILPMAFRGMWSTMRRTWGIL